MARSSLAELLDTTGDDLPNLGLAHRIVFAVRKPRDYAVCPRLRLLLRWAAARAAALRGDRCLRLRAAFSTASGRCCARRRALPCLPRRRLRRAARQLQFDRPSAAPRTRSVDVVAGTTPELRVASSDSTPDAAREPAADLFAQLLAHVRRRPGARLARRDR